MVNRKLWRANLLAVEPSEERADANEPVKEHVLRGQPQSDT